MTQLIYLSRHGTTFGNMRVDAQAGSSWHTNPKSDEELTDRGVQEAHLLGTYLQRLFENPIFVDSDVARTKMTAHLVAVPMNIVLVPGKNYHSLKALEEEVPWEGLTNEQKEGYYCGHHQKRAPPFAVDLGAQVHQELCKIGNVFSENNLIAILHGGINLGLIAYLTGQLKVMHNCGLYVLERTEDKLKVVSDYISLERMRNELELSEVTKREQAIQ